MRESKGLTKSEGEMKVSPSWAGRSPVGSGAGGLAA